MEPIFKDVFGHYSAAEAPFLHQQLQEWQQTKPLRGLRILHNIPLFQNTLLKIGCLVSAGAEVVVTNPEWLLDANAASVAALHKANIEFTPKLTALKHREFDIYLDCGAELYQRLGKPRLGAIEITGSGDQFYRQAKINFPVISINNSYTKQLETVFGTSHGSMQALQKLGHPPKSHHTWLLFGFGKIGRGIAFACSQLQLSLTVIEINQEAIESAKQLGISAIHAADINAVASAIRTADLIIMATGRADVLASYEKSLFTDKTLANLGILDEFGPRFTQEEVLYKKQPINFVLDDPTPIQFIDPALYAHNESALFLLDQQYQPGTHNMPIHLDADIVERWFDYHGTEGDMKKWFQPFQ